MKKKLIAVLMIGVMVFALTSCGEMFNLVGKWRITQVTAGDVVMDSDDISEMGIDAGYVKINKSGSCVLNLLGDEYEGTWTQNEDGSLEFEYDDALTGHAVIEDDVMTFMDEQGSEYLLSK